MKTLFDTKITKTKTFLLYGNLKDTIWCPDLMPRDIEHYLVKLLKSRGYEHIIFFGEPGTKGAYCLDEQSARFFFDNSECPLPGVYPEEYDFEENRQDTAHDESGASAEYGESEHEEDKKVVTGSSVSDMMDALDEYEPGAFGWDEGAAEEKEDNLTGKQQKKAGGRVRYAYRGQVMSEFLLKIHPLMLREDSHMAVIFYNMLTTQNVLGDLRDDILDTWEMNSRGNICLMLFPETLHNEAAVQSYISANGLESKFLLACSDSRQGYRMNPDNCIRVGKPCKDEIVSMLRYLSIVGNDKGRKLKLHYAELDDLVEMLLALSDRYAAQNGIDFEYMSEIYRRFDEFLNQAFLDDESWDGYLTEKELRRAYEVADDQKINDKPKKKRKASKKKAADWGIERIAPQKEQEESRKTLEEALAELDKLVGLEEVKAEVRKLVALQQHNNERVSQGLKGVGTSLHLVFAGAPGTGKTTVARLLGDIYYALGLLSRGHLVETDRSELVAGYQGQTAPLVVSKVREAKGGVLFIDEAYSLLRDGRDSFGQEAVDALVKQMEDNREDLLVVVAGYEKEMDKFLSSNPGLKSRFTQKINFADYTVEELQEIFLRMCKAGHYSVSEEALAEVQNVMECGIGSGRDFGNGRYVRTVFEEAIKNLAMRHSISGKKDVTQEELSTFSKEDITLPSNIGRVKKSNRSSLEGALAELDQLVGLKEVKESVHELIALQQLNAEREKKGLPIIKPSLHMIFAGTPGTGKTTVARILGDIYYALGLLSKGHLVETGRSQLVAGYEGQTAPLVEDKVADAMGGVLFIDEAYSLVRGEHDPFGKEAIDTLTKQMEDNREDLLVIAAGYPLEMQRFVDANPGLMSRFTQKIEFENYTVDELLEIFRRMCQKEKYSATEEAMETVRRVMKLGIASGRKFGNGRFARNVFEESIKKMAVRVGKLDIANLSLEDASTIAAEDISLPANFDGKDEKADDEIKDLTTEELLKELDQYIGLQQVKAQIHSLVNLSKVNETRKKRGLETKQVSLHMVFTGNPGTGKTTIARLVGKLYKSIGVLESGHVVETAREDLVAEFVGQTATKTRAKLEDALGGVLFIDEAYTLVQKAGIGTDFGQESIDTILKYMEDHRDEIVVIAAGYPDEMCDFIESNPGLESRFSNIIAFEDYTIDELMEILAMQCSKAGYLLTDGALQKARMIIQAKKSTESDTFANGREVRNLFEKACLAQSDRISIMENLDTISDEMLMTLTEDDFV